MSFSSFSRLYYTLFLSAFCTLPATASSGVTGINNHPPFQPRVQENYKTDDACRHYRGDSDNLRQAISRFELIADHVRMTATQHAHHKNQVDLDDPNNQNETKDKHHPRDVRPTDEIIAGHANKVLIEELHHLMDPKKNPRNLPNDKTEEEKTRRQGNRANLTLTREEALRLMHCGEQMISSVLRDIHSPTIHHANMSLENLLKDFRKIALNKANSNGKDEIETALKNIIAKVDTKRGMTLLMAESSHYSEDVKKMITDVKDMIVQGQSRPKIKSELHKLLEEIEVLNKEKSLNTNSVPPQKPGH